MTLKRNVLLDAVGRSVSSTRFSATYSLIMLLFGLPVWLSAQSSETSTLTTSPRVESGEADKRRELHLYMKGRYLYQKNCVECHGTTGRGNGPWAAELEIKPRNFRTGLYKFRTTPYGKLPVNEDLRRTIRCGISGTAMPVFAHFLDEDVDSLIVYLQNLSRSWKDDSLIAAPVPIPVVPEWFATASLREEHAVHGRVRFGELCAVCHGSHGKGDGPGAKLLIDAWEQPAPPADLTSPHHKSGDSPRDLYRTIATGMNGTPMIGFADLMTESDIWDLVAFIHQQGGQS